jgi:hypothetical protein
MTVLLIADLFGHERRPRLSSGSPLLLWKLIHEHELLNGGAALTIDPMILAWLEGRHELDRSLANHTSVLLPGLELPEWPLDGVVHWVNTALSERASVRLLIRTSDKIAARWFAAAFGQRVGLPILDVDAAIPDGCPDVAVRLHRQAFLDRSVPLIPIVHSDLCDPPAVIPFPVQIVHGVGDVSPAGKDVVDYDVQLSAPDPESRIMLWRRLWPPSLSWKPDSLQQLALCHEAELREIVAAASGRPANAQEAATYLRASLPSDVGLLARRIEPSFGWDDLVLPPQLIDRLRAIAFEGRERARLWADPSAARMFPYGRGLVSLFSGPPGCGKTMAAQVLAADLGLDLLTVDVSSVVSKWVGETARNLQQLLSSRSAQRSILFFDEADALYAKRVDELRDAQDRYANYDSSQLMTALESYPGIVVLATNLSANIDSAFLRRIRHAIDFPKPDSASREQIWRNVVDALFPKAQVRRLRPNLHKVAEIEATGAIIKNAALSAYFSSCRSGKAPDARLLGEMLARELGKEGAGLSARDLDAFVGNAR